MEELADSVGTRTMEQVYCKLQNMRTKFKNDDPEIRRVLREEFQKYQDSIKRRTSKTTQEREDGRKNSHQGRRMWTIEEMNTMCEALKTHGTSVRAITRELNFSRTGK